MTSDKKRLERQIEHLQAAQYALQMSCLFLLGLLHYFKATSAKVNFAMFLVVCGFAFWANRLLNKIAKQILFPDPYSLIPVPKEPQ